MRPPFGNLDIKIHIFCMIHGLRLRRFLSIIRVERVYPLSIHLYAERNIPREIARRTMPPAEISRCPWNSGRALIRALSACADFSI